MNVEQIAVHCLDVPDTIVVDSERIQKIHYADFTVSLELNDSIPVLGNLTRREFGVSCEPVLVVLHRPIHFRPEFGLFSPLKKMAELMGEREEILWTVLCNPNVWNAGPLENTVTGVSIDDDCLGLDIVDFDVG